MIILDKTTGEKIDTGDKNPRLSKLARRVYAWSEAIDKLEKIQQFDKKMVTLTYAPGIDWEKNHIRDFNRAVNRKLDKKLLAYSWVAELQKRGAVHYHMYLIVEPGIHVPTPDDSGMWPYGMSRIETGFSPFYMATYTSKKYQKVGNFPKGLRMHSVWIRKGLLPDFDFWIFKLSAYPKWLTDQILSQGDFYIGQLPTRREGGGWKIKHPNSIKNHIVWIPFFSPYEIVRYTTPGSGERSYGTD